MRGPLQRPTSYDIAQEQMRHDDALAWFGEMTCFLHWWRVEDFENGLVMRCTLCYVPYGDVANAYRQSAQYKCPNCYGSTFEGGFRNIWYRPALWSTTAVSDDVERRGDVQKIRGEVEFTSDLDLREGDIAIRHDSTRWEMDQPQWTEITTGYGSQRGVETRRIRGVAAVNLEAPDAAAYLPVIDLNALADVGWRPHPQIPHPLDQGA